jgi:hypothetical protein
VGQPAAGGSFVAWRTPATVPVCLEKSGEFVD